MKTLSGKGEIGVDATMQLKEKQQVKTRELEVKQAVLLVKKSGLGRARTSLAVCASHRDKIQAEEQAINEQIRQLDSNIDHTKESVNELTRSIVSLQKELNRVFIFSFRRKKELKEKIKSEEGKLVREKNKLDKFLFDRSKVERKSGLLDAAEGRVAEQERLVAFLEKEVLEIECDIERIQKELSEVEISIQIQVEEARKAEEARLAEEARKAEEARLAEEARKAEKARLAEEARKAEEARLAEEARKIEEQTKIGDEAEKINKTILPPQSSLKVFIDEADIPYFERYSVVPNHYSQISVNSLGFSVRVEKRLLKNGIGTVEKLLRTSDSVLLQISGFGKGCIDELHSYLETLLFDPTSAATASDIIPVNVNDEKNTSMLAELLPYREQMLYGDFSFLNDIELSPQAEQLLNRFKEARLNLDFELIKGLLYGSSTVFAISEMLNDFIRQVEYEKKVQDIIKNIPSHRLDAKASWAIKCFTNDEIVLNYLQKYIVEDVQTLREYLISNAQRIGQGDQRFHYLMKWCQYDLNSEIEQFFIKQIKNERQLQVITKRADRKTLDEIGKMLDVTRERVRQIENTVRKRFASWQKHQRIMFKIFLDLGEETGLSSIEIMDCLGAYGKEFVYLMKGCESEEINYDKQLDMFIIQDLSLTERIQAYVESLPDAFSEKKLTQFLQVAEEENEYPDKMVMAVIEDTYKKTGDTYHRFKLTLAAVYGDVMRKYYPSGIHVYDAEEIEGFRQHVMDDYSIDISDKSDHAIGSLLGRIGILCGRGIYKLGQGKDYISKELAKRIHDYIEQSDAPIFMTNTLFSIFEEELMAEGIDNKYFLQGILRDLYENDWIFRRDYISKDESYTSVYSSIVGYIRNSRHPVSKEDLNREFPGVTDIVVSLSVSDPNILNLFGQYIHSCRLRLSDTDLKYLKDTVERFLDAKEVCHYREIYDYISADYPVLLTNNFVQYAISFYSLLEYLFRDHYNFSKPYIAKKNATIERALDVLKDIIKESERIDISEIQAFAREHRTQIYSIREFIDSCNDTHLLISDLEVASIEYIGVTEQIAKDLEHRIVAEIDTTMPIHQLQCIHSLPSINVEWNAWLIYSVLNKWSTMLEVGASASQFRHAYPVVAPLGKLDASMVDKAEGDHDGKLVMADDLSKIDDLIGDFVLDDLEDLNGL